MITRSENECYHCHSRCIKLPYFLMILIIYWLPERVPKAPPTTTTAKNAKPQQHSKQAFISINDNFNNFNNNHKSFDFHNRINGKYKFYFTFCWARHIIINSLKYFNTFRSYFIMKHFTSTCVISVYIYRQFIMWNMERAADSMRHGESECSLFTWIWPSGFFSSFFYD